MQYINWDNLKNIPFFLCQVVEDKENQDIDIYYLGERVFHDYDHVGHYLRSAIVLFQQIRNRTADWVNLENLSDAPGLHRGKLQPRHRSGRLIYGEDFDGQEPRHTYTPDERNGLKLSANA